MPTIGYILNDIFTEGPVDIFMTLSFFASIIYSLWVYAHDFVALVLFIGFFFYIAWASVFVVKLSNKLCMWMQNKWFVGQKNENLFTLKPNRMKKTGDQFWQLFLHVSSCIFELPLILGNTWWTDPVTCFIPSPKLQIPSLLVKLAYTFEAAAYIYDGIGHRFWNSRKNDYYVMFAHHIVTVVLIAGSYSWKFYAFGTVVMYLHDFSDISVDLLVIINQCKLEGSHYFFATELAYCNTTITWFVVRNIMFPFKLLKPLYKVVNIIETEYKESMLMFRFLEVLLHCLYVMHAYWLWVFVRIGYSIVTMDIHDEKREESYENDKNDKKKAE